MRSDHPETYDGFIFISGSAEAQREDPLLQVGDESGASQVS
jgi:hypothetical protein